MDHVIRVFKDKKPNIKMLLQYGFEKQENGYIYKTNIMNNKLTLFIQISCDNKITTKLIDNDFRKNMYFTLLILQTENLLQALNMNLKAF